MLAQAMKAPWRKQRVHGIVLALRADHWYHEHQTLLAHSAIACADVRRVKGTTLSTAQNATNLPRTSRPPSDRACQADYV